MTQVGHTLTGLAIGTLCLPTRHSWRRQLAHLLLFGLLANIPDLPFPQWGHQRYDISHSLFVNGGLILLLTIGCSRWKKAKDYLGRYVLLGGSLAWLSHLLLDSFYNHGLGVAIYWPFSGARLALPVPWFSVVESFPPPLTFATAQVIVIELSFYGSLLLLAFFFRKIMLQ